MDGGCVDSEQVHLAAVAIDQCLAALGPVWARSGPSLAQLPSSIEVHSSNCNKTQNLIRFNPTVRIIDLYRVYIVI
jgi:hypothetical protein